MQLDFKAPVSRVIYFTLNLVEEIQEFPEEVDSEECRSAVLSLLQDFENSQPHSETVQSVRYALAAWVDDILSRTPWPHSAYWNANLLEQELFGTACRQWRFFEQAEAALRRQDWAALSVFQFCVKSGFRGIYAKNRMKVQLNDRLPMVRNRSRAARSLPIFASVLQEESSGVHAPLDWEAGSIAAVSSVETNGTDSPARLPNSTSVLPATLTEWCRTTFWALGHRSDESSQESNRFAVFYQALPSKRVLTEWAIVMAIGVLLSVVLISLGR